MGTFFIYEMGGNESRMKRIVLQKLKSASNGEKSDQTIPFRPSSGQKSWQ